MGQILHGSATTTEAVRQAIQHSQESLRKLAKRYGVNPKTIAKWKARSSVSDLRTGPKELRSTVLSAEEEAVVVAFRGHALLPLDDCLYALQPTIPYLTRSSLHRCLRRHGISGCRWSKAKPRSNTNSRPIRSASFLSTSPRFEPLRASSISSSPSTERQNSPSSRCTRKLRARPPGLSAPPDRRRPLQDPHRPHRQRNHFTTPGNTSSAAPDIKAALDAGEPVWAHAFEYACAQNDIDHRLTKPKHPWTNGQVERMNRTIKDATVKRYFYETHDQLRTHLRDFVDAYNFARRLKTLSALTPYEFICKAWTSEPHKFKFSPLQQMTGRNS